MYKPEIAAEVIKPNNHQEELIFDAISIYPFTHIARTDDGNAQYQTFIAHAFLSKQASGIAGFCYIIM